MNPKNTFRPAYFSTNLKIVSSAFIDFKIASIVLLFQFLTLTLHSQTWEVPTDKQARVSPVQFTAETVKKGEAVFTRNCASCHGIPTKANFVSLVPSPGDPAGEKFQNQSDGSMFYKITTGKGPMPQFKDILTEEERWEVISYFRSFNKDYIQPSIEAGKLFANAVVAKLSVSLLKDQRKIQVLVTDTLKNPIKNSEVLLFTKRYFGNMPMADGVRTNENGIALFDLPKDIPGDKDGNIEVIAKLNSEGGDFKKSEIMAIGVPTFKPPLTKPRAMWNVGSKAPVWLILSYSGVVLGVWGFLIYIILQIGKLRKAGLESKNQ